MNDREKRERFEREALAKVHEMFPAGTERKLEKLMGRLAWAMMMPETAAPVVSQIISEAYMIGLDHVAEARIEAERAARQHRVAPALAMALATPDEVRAEVEAEKAAAAEVAADRFAHGDPSA